MKSPISELDYGKELFGQNLPNRRYNPNWKKLIPNDEPNTDDENKALTLLKKWYDDEKSPAELTKLFGELLKLKSKFPNVLNPTMGRSEYENNDFFRGTLLPLSHLIKLGGWKKYDGLDFDGAIQTKSSYVWKPKSSKGFTSVTPTADLALNFALDYAWKGIRGMWERNILKSLQGKGDTLVPVILVFKDTHPNMIMNPIFSNLLSANIESEVILVGKSSKPSYIIVPNFDVVQQEAEEENIKLHNYFKGLKENTMKSSDKQLNESFYNEFVSQFMSEVMEDEGGSNEIKVGEYQTKYFHVCPGAISLYKDIESKGVDMGMAQRSAMLQDALYFVEKHIQRDGYEPEKDYVMVAKNLAKNIMKLAEMMGLEEEHNYIQGHVDTIEKVVKEKGLEERVIELTEENVPTDPSKWSYYKSQAKKKFDVYPSAYANAWAAKQYKAAGGGWRTKKKESVNEAGRTPLKILYSYFRDNLKDTIVMVTSVDGNMITVQSKDNINYGVSVNQFKKLVKNGDWVKLKDTKAAEKLFKESVNEGRNEVEVLEKLFKFENLLNYISNDDQYKPLVSKIRKDIDKLKKQIRKNESVNEVIVTEGRRWGTYGTPEAKVVIKSLDKALAKFETDLKKAHTKYQTAVKEFTTGAKKETGSKSGFHDSDAEYSVEVYTLAAIKNALGMKQYGNALEYEADWMSPYYEGLTKDSVNEAKVSSEDKAYFKKHKKEIMKMIEDDLLLDPVEAIKLHKQKNEATAAEEDEFHTKLDKLVHKTFGKSSDEKDESVNERDEYAKKVKDRERKRKYDANHVIKSLIAAAKENSKQRKTSTKEVNQLAAIWGDLDLKPIIKKIKSKGELNTYELAAMFPDTIPFYQIDSILLDIWYNRFKYLGYGKRYDINRTKKAPWKYIDKSKNEVVDEYDVETIEEMKDFQNFIKEYKADINEAEYQGRDVKLGKIMQGDVKKFKVYVKNDKGNVVKVNFGQKGMTIKKDNPGARKSFRSRMNCDSPGPRWKARYWSCRKW